MTPRLTASGPPLTLADLQAAEHRLNVALPDDYRALLLANNGGKPRPAWFRHGQDPSEVAEITRFFEKYRVTYLLLDRLAYTTDYFQTNVWLQQTQPEAITAYTNLTSGNTPVMAQAIERCRVYTSARYVVLDAACVEAFAGG